MQHIIFRVVSVLVFILCSFGASAQNSDSAIIVHIATDSTGHKLYELRVKKDSLSRKIHHRKELALYSKVRASDCDSLKLKLKTYVRLDSMRTKLRIGYQYSDSMQLKLKSYVRLDSLKQHALRNTRYKTYRSMDSLTRMKVKLAYTDSLYKKMKVYRKMDSTRLRIHLQNLKIQLQRLRTDSINTDRKIRTREITMEMPYIKEGVVYVEDIGRKVIIKTIPGDKVKVKTTIYLETDIKLNDIELFKTIDLQLKQSDTGVSVLPVTKTVTAKGGNMAVAGKEVKTRGNKKIPVTVYVPVGSKVNVESRSEDIEVKSDLVFLKANMSNADLSMQDAQRAVITSRYGKIRAGTIKEATLDLTNCDLNSKNIDKLTVNSKYSKVNFYNSSEVKMKSLGDQYRIAQVNAIEGSKNFGRMNIDLLKNNMVLTGANSDLRIGGIASDAELVKIDNKYADVRLALTNLGSYSVDFDGRNSKVFTPFETNAITDASNRSRVNFTATVGNVKGSHTKFQINCSSCNVDFNN